MEQYNAITIIGLNRPAKRNALNSELITALRKELKAFEANQSSRAAVLYGTGGNFCAGLDLDDVPSSQQVRLPLMLTIFEFVFYSTSKLILTYKILSINSLTLI